MRHFGEVCRLEVRILRQEDGRECWRESGVARLSSQGPHGPSQVDQEGHPLLPRAR
jgi:hypothetical protein